MVSPTIRRAVALDMDAGVALIYAAGEKLVKYIFGNQDEALAMRYLRMAWRRGHGQYGFNNHWVAEVNGEVAGLVSCWHDQLPTNFDSETMASITDLYSHQHAIDVVMRSREYADEIPPPRSHEFAIGHVAVFEQFKRHGVATALMNHMLMEARRFNKDVMILDVENTNVGAQAFYSSIGFTMATTDKTFTRMHKSLTR